MSDTRRRDDDRLRALVALWRPRNMTDLERVRRVIADAYGPAVAGGVVYFLLSDGTGIAEMPRTTRFLHARRLEQLERPATGRSKPRKPRGRGDGRTKTQRAA